MAAGVTWQTQYADNARRALVTDLTARSLALQDTDPSLAAQLALAAWKLSPDEETDALLLRLDDASAQVAVARRLDTGPGTLLALAQDSSRQELFTSTARQGVRAWSLWNGQLLTALSTDSQVVGLATDSQAPLLAGTTSDGRVLLWNTGSLTSARTPVWESPSVDAVSGTSAVGFTPDGKEFYQLSANGWVGIWRTTDHQLLHNSYLVTGPVAVASASDPVSVPAAGSASGTPEVMELLEDGTVFRIDLDTGQATRVTVPANLTAPFTSITASTYQGGEPTVAVGTGTGVAVWQIGASGTAKDFPYAGVAQPVTSLEFVGPVLAIGTKGGVSLAESGGLLTDAPIGGQEADQFAGPTSEKSGLLAIAGAHGPVIVVDTGRVSTPGVSASDGNPSTVLAAAPDGDLLLGDAVPPTSWTDSLYLYHFPSGDSSTEQAGGGAAGPLSGPSESNARKVLRPAASWWPAKDNFFANSGTVDTSLAAAAGEDPNHHAAVFVWDARTGKPLKDLAFPYSDNARAAGNNGTDVAESVVIAPKPGLLIAADSAGQVAGWSTRTWQLVFSVSTGAPNREELVLGADGDSVLIPMASGSSTATVTTANTSGLLGILDLGTHRLRFTRVEGKVGAVAVSPRDGRIATVLDDDSVVFFDQHGRALAGAPVVRVPGAPVDAVFSPDGAHLAVTTVEGQVLVYRTSNGQLAYPAFTLPAGEAALVVAWDPLGRYLAVDTRNNEGANDGVLGTRVWALDPSQWAAQLCAAAGGGLPRSEWHQYVGGGTPYTPTCPAGSGST